MELSLLGLPLVRENIGKWSIMLIINEPLVIWLVISFVKKLSIKLQNIELFY